MRTASILRAQEAIRRSALLIILLCLPVIIMIRTGASVVDPDIWWHLRTGEWILDHGSVPLADPFSIHGAGKEWVAYSWLFEVLVFKFHHWFGLSGIVLFNVVLTIAITTAIFALVQRFEHRFIAAVGVTAASIVSILPLVLTPRPWLFSVLFFTVELHILLRARKTGRTRGLWYLPPLFALWANLHVEFVYGLLLLGVAAFESLVSGMLGRFTDAVEEGVAGRARMMLLTLACVAATLLNPYHYRVYKPMFDFMGQRGFYDLISELQSPQFRTLSEWLVLSIVVGAAFILGRRQKINVFFTLMLAMTAAISFRSKRDMWIVAIASAGIIAASCPRFEQTSRYILGRARVLCIAAGIPALIVFTMRVTGFSENALQRKLAQVLPVEAAAVVESRAYTGPLYNHFDWGGYLIWRLPSLPVAMDGRTNVYGEDKMKQSLKVWTGKSTWNSDPELASAGVVIAQIDQPLTSLLKLDARFNLVYEDKVAAVFVARDRGQFARNDLVSRD